MNTIVTKISNTNNDMLKMEKRVRDLEKLTSSLMTSLTNEIESRKQLEQGTLSSQSGHSAQINTLKDGIAQLGQVVSESLEDFKQKITQDTSDKTTKLYAFIEDKMKLFDYYDKKNAENDFRKNNFENETKSRLCSIENEVKESLKQFRDELNTNTARIDFIEKKCVDNYNIIKEDLSVLTKEMLNIKNQLISLNKFKDSTVDNFKNVHSDFLHQEETIGNFVSKVNFSLNEFDNKIQSYEASLKTQTETFNDVKEEIYGHIDILDSKLHSKLKEMNDLIFKQSTLQCKEIDNFENHVLTEQQKFTEYMEGSFDKQNENMKKLFDYTNQDLDIVKGKVETLEENMNSIKNRFFANLNEAEEFLTKKYEGLFRMISSQGLNTTNNSSKL